MPLAGTGALKVIKLFHQIYPSWRGEKQWEAKEAIEYLGLGWRPGTLVL